MTTRTRPDRASTAVEDPPRSHVIACRIPTDVHEWMRTTGSQVRRTMRSMVLEAVATYRTEVEAGRIAPEHGKVVRSEAAISTYNLRAGAELYEWLRATAFDAHTSINALVVAALARATTKSGER